jgi:hypothetical protein
MAKHYRVQIYWGGRGGTPRDHARPIAAFLAGLADEVHPAFSDWLYESGEGGATRPADSAAACEEAVALGTIAWATGDTRRLSYRPRFFLERKDNAPVELTITCGIEPLNLGPIFTPNRLELLVRADVGDDRASRAGLEGALRKAVEVFEPLMGFAGTETSPSAPLPLFSDGVPSVGWMTYLKASYPPVPRTFPAPSVAYPVDAHGTLVVAHPELYAPGVPAHEEAIERVHAALKAAGVLVPAHQVA